MSDQIERFRFRRKESVSAVQHSRDVQATFDGLREIGAMQCAGFVGLESGAIEVRYLDHMEVAQRGDWIVVSPMRGVHVCEEGDFRQTYEPADQPARGVEGTYTREQIIDQIAKETANDSPYECDHIFGVENALEALDNLALNEGWT